MRRYQIAIELVAELLAKVGPPTTGSQEKFDELIQQFSAQPRGNGFCLLVEMAPKRQISFTSNINITLGLDDLSLSEYLDLIHERWWMTYLFFTKAIYELVTSPFSNLSDQDYALQFKIPLRIASGNYAWFNQLTFPGAVDEKGRLCSHFNTYQWDRNYEEVAVLSTPILTKESRLQPMLIQWLQSRAQSFFLDTYLSGLKPRAEQVLFLYRKLVIDHDDAEISSQLVADASHQFTPNSIISKATVEKRNQDILAAARKEDIAHHSPIATLKEVKKIARFLNLAFGPPLYSNF
ncbi:MAG: hypothetical protein AAF433_11165 [Bacteroidota bacterium]